MRELVDSQGQVRARYDYDPYGRVTKISGDRDSLFLYAGYLFHAQSGLFLTQFRAYDPELGRWISRDPIAENGGMNLYGYVGNNPIALTDPTGLSPWTKWDNPLWDLIDNPFANALVNFGDGITFGLTEFAREQNIYGLDFAPVNKCGFINKAARFLGNMLAIAIIGHYLMAGLASFGIFGESASTTLYRAVSPGEFSNIAGTGEFFGQEGVSMGGKWFATTAKNAATWGERMFADTGFRVLGVRVSNAGLKGAMFKESLDGIGAAWYVAQESLPALNAAIRAFILF